MSDLVTLAVPREYGYVILTAAASFMLGHWHGFRSSGYRRRAKLGYPTPYAPTTATNATSSGSADEKSKQEKDYYLFNCAQRAHGNFMENQPTFLAALLVSGVQYPVAATVLGAGWCVSRVVYMYGYTMESKSNGKGRLYGLTWAVAQLGLCGLCVPTAWSLLTK